MYTLKSNSHKTRIWLISIIFINYVALSNTMYTVLFTPSLTYTPTNLHVLLLMHLIYTILDLHTHLLSTYTSYLYIL